jgi:hypothetical protein
MKMSKPTFCCDSCFEMIARENAHAAKLWLDMCDLYLHSTLFGIMEDSPSVRLLETKRFITTTETPNMLLVKVHGYQSDDESAFFCVGDCEY